jgi:hypothetical protein
MQMRIMDRTFERVAHLEPARRPEGEFVEYNAHKEFENPEGLHLHRYGCGPFCEINVPAEHSYGCVFALTVDGELVFVGETENLATQFNEGFGTISPRHCYAGGQSTNCRINASILNSAKSRKAIELWSCQVGDRRELESELIRDLKPAWNILDT